MAIKTLNPGDFHVGMKVPLRYQGNMARGGRGDSYRMAEVTKIGRKYIYCGDVAFDLSTSYEKSDYAADYKLYKSEEDLFEELEAEKIISEVRTFFGGFGQVDLSIDQLRAIAKAMGIEVKVPGQKG